VFHAFFKKRWLAAAIIFMSSVDVLAQEESAAASEPVSELVSETVSQIDAIAQTYHLYSKHVVDDVVVEKRYSSSSEYRGLFGFGWCSDLDGRVDKYADQSIRFSGCDITNANLLDPRKSATQISKLDRGYRRVREDGAVQIFDKDGRLISLEFTNQQSNQRASLMFKYSQSSRPDQIVSVRSRIDLQYNSDFDLIESLRGSRQALRFAYRLDLLVLNVTESYSYTPHRGVSQRSSAELRETVDYEPGGRLVVRVEKRFRASPDERLLMSLVANGESDEIQINAERGAEMRPVRILYHLQRKTLDLFGDRETARRILEWMKS
jgi:hypothetical protein